MPRRPVLLFDVMDTLVYNPFNREIPAFFGLSPAALLDQKDPTAWPQFELGQIDEAEYYRRYFRDRRSFDHDAFEQVVADAYRWIPRCRRLAESSARRGLRNACTFELSDLVPHDRIAPGALTLPAVDVRLLPDRSPQAGC